MTGEKRTERMRILLDEIRITRRDLAQLETQYRELTGWDVPQFRPGSGSAAIMDLIADTGSASVRLLREKGNKPRAVTAALLQLSKAGYIRRVSRGVYVAGAKDLAVAG